MQNAVEVRARWRNEILPLAIVTSLSALYFFAWFNRFAGLRSGDGEFSGGIAWLAGLRPYRDYFTAGPPLNQIKSAVELAIFGKYLIVSRTMAVLERLLIASTLYAWLRRVFSVQAAMLASLVTIIVSAGDRTDPLASYNHDAVFMAMLAGLFASFALDAHLRNKFLAFSFAAGACGGLSLLTKQTVGGAAAISTLMFGAFAMLLLDGFKRTALWCGMFAAGVAAPIIACGIFLWRMQVLRACVEMLFVSGPKAKASSPLMFLSREVMVARENWMWLALALVALLLSVWPIYRACGAEHQSKHLSQKQLLYLAAISALVIVVAELLAFTSNPVLEDLGKASVYYTFIGTALLGLFAVATSINRAGEARLRTLQIAFVAAVSWSSAAALSLSWPAFEAMALPGLGLLLACAVDGAKQGGKCFLYLVMAAMIFFQVREKFYQPFSFDHQDEPPVRFENSVSQNPMLQGMRLAPETVRLIYDTDAAIRTYSSPHDTIFTYPELGLFYSLSGRNPTTRTFSHNIDVVQDSFAREEAARLLAAPPSVIVYAKPSEENLRSDEHLWRQDRPSGQRRIVAALDQIVSSYQLVGTYRLAPSDNPIRLYVRPQSDGNTASNKALH